MKPVDLNKRIFDISNAASALQSEAFLVSDFDLDDDAANALLSQEGGHLFGALFSLIDHLRRSDLFEDHFALACDEGWSIALDDLDMDAAFQIDQEARCAVLNAHGLSLALVANCPDLRLRLSKSLVGAMREIAQESRDHDYSSRFAPDSLLQIERTRAADSVVCAVVVAWELDQEGDKALWRDMLSSDNSDIARAFDSYLALCPDMLEDFHIYDAMNAAFTQWFSCDNRINLCDHDVLEAVDGILQQQGGQAFGRDRLMPLDLEVLSCLPSNHVAYLQNRGEELILDPYYGAMNECVNQSHLFQIMQELDATIAGGVHFRDAKLAAKIFPEGSMNFLDA